MKMLKLLVTEINVRFFVIIFIIVLWLSGCSNLTDTTSSNMYDWKWKWEWTSDTIRPHFGWGGQAHYDYPKKSSNSVH